MPPRSAAAREPAGDAVLARALGRARWTIFWERLWPALASIATVVGLFLAVSWLGLWLWLPPIGRAIGLGVFFLLAAAAFAPFLMLRVPSRMDGLRRLDRNSGLPHRPATAIADEIAAPTDDPFRIALWRAHVERALRAAKTLKAGDRRCRGWRGAIRSRCARWWLVLVVATFFAAGGERMKRVAAAFDWQGVMVPANFRIDAWVSAADLYRPAAGDPAGPAAGRAGADRAPRSRCRPAARWSSARPASRPRCGRERRARRAAGRRRRAPAPTGTEERRFVINDAGAATVRGAAASDVTWQFTAIPDQPPTIALAKDPERQARGALQLVLQARGRLRRRRRAGDVQAAEQRRHQRPAAARALRCAGFPAGAAAGAHPQRRRPDHQGSDRASLGRRRRGDDADRARRGRQRRPERAVRDAAAGAAVHQADGARADRAAPRSWRSTATRRRSVLTALDALTIAPERFNIGDQRLSRPALDLLAAGARQERRPVARRRRAHVGHGGAPRGRQRLRCRAGAARGAGSAAPGAGARRERRGDQEAHRPAARGARQVPAGAGRADAQESAAARAAARSQYRASCARRICGA